MNTEAVTHFRHESKPIDEFGVRVAFLLANTASNDVGLAGKPESGGLPRMIPQRLFRDT